MQSGGRLPLWRRIKKPVPGHLHSLRPISGPGQHRRAVGVVDRHLLALLARERAEERQRTYPELTAQFRVVRAQELPDDLLAQAPVQSIQQRATIAASAHQHVVKGSGWSQMKNMADAHGMTDFSAH